MVVVSWQVDFFTYVRVHLQLATDQSVYKIKNGIIRESLGFFLSFRLLLLRTRVHDTCANQFGASRRRAGRSGDWHFFIRSSHF